MTVPSDQRNARSPIRKLIRSVRRKGVGCTLRLIASRSYAEYRDWRLGISTTGHVDGAALGIPCSSGYVAANYRYVDMVFRYLEPGRNRDVLLDYGSGKGRVVVSAATYPFRRVIGVESSPELAEISSQNVARAAQRSACDVEIMIADAIDYDVPDDVSVIFLFNSFKHDLLRSVQERIQHSLRRVARPLRVVYLFPRHREDSFADCTWLAREVELPLPKTSRFTLRVYRHATISAKATTSGH